MNIKDLILERIFDLESTGIEERECKEKDKGKIKLLYLNKRIFKEVTGIPYGTYSYRMKRALKDREMHVAF